MAKVAVKKRCTYPGCRKMQASGKRTCKVHSGNGIEAKPEPQGVESVIKMTELERLGLVKIETECLNILLQLRNHELETDEVKRKLASDLQARASHREQLIAIAETKKAEQQRVVKEVAEKYNLDPMHLVYDPETGVLRDMRQET
jgi:hypothetical protein